MRNQSKFNIKERELNTKEKEILAEVEGISGLKIHAQMVAYERHTPRATLCTISCAPWWAPIWIRFIKGVTIRNRRDKEDPETGQLQSFRRALNDYVIMKRGK